MGEFSKKIGDIGEKVVADFLSIIGWKDPVRNEDIASVDSEFRKYSNGIDGYYHYLSPMISGTVENVLYSCKYSSAPYPASKLVPQFKQWYEELAKAIESFKKSELKQRTIYMHENVDTHFDRGILFWLNNSGSLENDIVSKLTRVELGFGINHDGIFVVDNRRMEFIYDSISYAKSQFKDFELDFVYFSNGLNNDERNHRNGKILPVQFINSSVLPIRASKDQETIVVISTIDPFNREDLMKYMGIAKNLGNNLQGSTIICFSDYLESTHLSSVNNIKQIFNDASFTQNLEVVNYNNPILK